MEEAIAPKTFLSIEDIDAAKDEEYSEIEAWGGVALAGSLMAEDFIEWQEANEGPAKRNTGLRLITKSLCGRSAQCPACNGSVNGASKVKHEGLHPRIGTDKHIEIFKKKSVKMTEKVVAEIVKLNGLKVKGAEAKND